MKIGIIGSGNIGANAARRFAAAGHEVAISNSRGPETLAGLVAELGPKATAETTEGAARFGEVVLVAIPFGKFDTLPAEALSGSIVVDATNYYPERDGQVAPLDAGTTTSSELVAAHLPGSRVVKAFNTIWFEHLRTQGDTSRPFGERRAILLAGDDEAAKRTVAGLIAEIGFGPVDTGSLAEGGRRQQPGAPLYGADVTAAEAEAALGR